MRVSIVFVFSLIAVIYLSSESEAEENFTISVDPGWMDEKEGNCKTMTGLIGNSTEDGTYEYEECDYYLGYETNLTNDTYSWLIGDNGTIAEWRAKYYGFSRLPLTPNSLNSTFVFSLHGTNFSKNIEYTFSYVVYSHLNYEEWGIDQELSQITLAESQVTFFGNDSIEANLSGTFNGGVAIDSWISEDVETLVLKDECSTVYAHVKLEGKNVSTGNVSLSETYVSGGFFLNDTTREKCALYGYTNGYNYNSPDTTLVSIGLIGLPLSLIIFSYSSAQRLNTNMFVVLGLMVITFPVFYASYFIILLCWAFGANFGGGERDQEKYERSGEIGPALITIGSFVSSLICLFLITIYGWVSSDIRLKRNIILIGQSQSNLNIYEYNYVWSNKKYRGVMAQDLLKSNPEAVTKLFGYYLVNYNKIDVDFERI